MFCDKCGTKLNDSDIFCTSCGNKVIRLDTPSVPVADASPATDSTPANSAPFVQEPVQNPANYQSSNYRSSNYPAQSTPPANYAEPAKTNPSATFSEDTNTPPATSYYGDAKATAPYKPKSNKGLVATISVCSVLLVILAAVFVYIMLNKGDDSATTPVNSGGEVVQSDGENLPDDETEEEKEEIVVNEIDNDQIAAIIGSNSSYTDFGIYVRNLNNGYEFGYNENSEFLASAMCQVVILDAISRAADEENLDLDSEYIYFQYLANGKEAPSSKNENGQQVSVKDCIEDVAVYGDNNKSNQLIDYLGSVYGENGFDVLDNMLSENGYIHTDINRKIFTNDSLIDKSVPPNVTSAKEIANMYDNLINNSSYGSKSYMKNIFKSISNEGTPIGLKKLILEHYDISSVNALNSQSTNDVAIISDGETEILVAILCCTQEDKTSVEDYAKREYVQDLLIDYILETQFE